MGNKVELVRGKEYPVELYPLNDVVSGIYIGSSSGEHFFSVEGKSPNSRMLGNEALDGFLVLNDNFVEVKNDGVVSHKHISSIGVGYIARGTKETLENSDLIKKLQGLGASI